MSHLMQYFVFYLMAFIGILVMLISLINIQIIETKNKKSEQKKSKSKPIKFLIVGLIVYILSRILNGQLF